MVLPLSLFEKSNNAYYNSLVMIDADGSVLDTYRKTHIPNGPAYQENSSLSRDTGYQCGTPAMPKSALASAGISGSRKPRVASALQGCRSDLLPDGHRLGTCLPGHRQPAALDPRPAGPRCR